MAQLEKTYSGWLERRQTQHLLQVLSGDGATTRCVGGCVRDALMGLVYSGTSEVMRNLMATSEGI